MRCYWNRWFYISVSFAKTDALTKIVVNHSQFDIMMSFSKMRVFDDGRCHYKKIRPPFNTSFFILPGNFGTLAMVTMQLVILVCIVPVALFEWHDSLSLYIYIYMCVCVCVCVRE